MNGQTRPESEKPAQEVTTSNLDNARAMEQNAHKMPDIPVKASFSCTPSKVKPSTAPDKSIKPPQNLIIGEDHGNPAAREYVTQKLDEFKQAGYTAIGYEMYDGFEVGNELDPTLKEGELLSLRNVFKRASNTKNEDVLRSIESQMDSYLLAHRKDKNDKSLGKMISSALRKGFRVVCLDYKDNLGKTNQNRIEKYNNYASKKLNKLNKQGISWVAISGADHIKGIAKQTGACPLDLSKREK